MTVKFSGMRFLGFDRCDFLAGGSLAECEAALSIWLLVNGLWLALRSHSVRNAFASAKAACLLGFLSQRFFADFLAFSDFSAYSCNSLSILGCL